MTTEAIRPHAEGGSSRLPRLVDVKATRVRYDPPRRHYAEGKLVSQDEGVELLVRTATPMPVLDLTPVLFIGDVVVNEYERAGQNLYRFRAYRVEALLQDARISLGWDYAPETRVASDFRFTLSDPFPTA